MNEPPTSVRWGIIGTGGISDQLVPDLRSVPGAVVTGVWGRTTERAAAFAAAHDIGFSTADRKSLLDRDDIDAVYIATPIATHLPIALEALEAGKHVLIEKPMAMSAADVEQIFDRAAAAARFAMEAMWMRYNPLHVELHRRINEGLLGKPMSVRAGFGMPFPEGGSRWSADLGGSTVLDQGIYAVTLAQRILGIPRRISATGTVRDGVDVSAQITLEFEGGRFAHIACSALEFVEPTAGISGTQGWAVIDAMFWAGTSASLHAGSVNQIFGEPEKLVLKRQGKGYTPMLRAVCKAIAAGYLEEPDHDRKSTVEVARTLDAVLDLVHMRPSRVRTERSSSQETSAQGYSRVSRG